MFLHEYMISLKNLSQTNWFEYRYFSFDFFSTIAEDMEERMQHLVFCFNSTTN